MSKPSTKQCQEQSCLMYKFNQSQINPKRCVKAPNFASSVQQNSASTANGSIIPSRLPQKSDSKIPAPQPTPLAAFAHKKLQTFVPKASNKPNSRSNSPSSISKCSSNSQTSLNPCQANNSQQKEIRPPRPSSIPAAPSVAVTSPANAIKPTQSKLNPPKTNPPQNQIKKNNIITTVKDDKSNPSVKVTKTYSNSFGFGVARSDSSASLAELDSSCRSGLKPPTSRNVSMKIRSGAIPAPKSRPNSACIENTINFSATQNNYSTLRPLSSSNIPKMGLAPVREDSFTKDREEDVKNSEEKNAPNKSEPNVARVSPIRRQPELNQNNTNQHETYSANNANEGNSSIKPAVNMESSETQESKENFPLDCRSQIKLNGNITAPNGLNGFSLNTNKSLTLTSLKNRSQSNQSRVKEEAAYSDSECMKKHAKSNVSEVLLESEIMKRQLKSKPFNTEKIQMRAGIKRKECSGGNDQRNVTPSPTPSCYQSRRLSRNGELRASTTSLLSLSSTYSNHTDDKHYQEIKKLRAELIRSNEKVSSLTMQLATNAQMIVAFEQSLASMTARLHQYSVVSEQKDREINRLKSTIEALRKECQVDYSPSHYSTDSDCETRRKKLKEQKTSSSDKEEPSGWFRGSISRAFKKNRSRHKSGGSVSDADVIQTAIDCSSVPSTPLLSPKMTNHNIVEEEDFELIQKLRKQLMEKDKLLTDIRLEALSTSHQLENMKEIIAKLKAEAMLLREENNKFKQCQNRESIASSICSLTSFSDSSVFGSHEKNLNVFLNKLKLGMITVTLNTTWHQMDNSVKQTFQDYIEKLDPSLTLDVNPNEVKSYFVGNKFRELHTSHSPESPFSWVAGGNEIRIRLAEILNEVAVNSLVPKAVFEKMLPLIKDQKRLVICGPEGCGKSYAAHSLAEYLVKTYHQDSKEDIHSAIAIFTIKQNQESELNSFLTNVVDSCESKYAVKAIILNNIENISNIVEVFAPFKSIDSSIGPFIIGTMRETTPVTTSLQLHFNFRVVVWTIHMEPCKGFLSRCLRKKYFGQEIETRVRSGNTFDPNVLKILDWIVELCNRLNRCFHKFFANNTYFGKFSLFDNFDGKEFNLGPHLFISCPLNVERAQEWFINLWNQSIFPQLKSVSTSTNRNYFVDVDKWLRETYPWTPKQLPRTLLTLNEEELADSSSTRERESDPLVC
ncbi:protein sickie-like protein [Dinothrombium tinctorium]|uniref:Protein sickie-like protein n=1 Tax=Dinothrombium tinctorium TaxID=1965070 RepID=A0A3S3S693_9ACAR|nr:protein sickie-like protein [Dinothrombium tinctorium]